MEVKSLHAPRLGHRNFFFGVSGFVGVDSLGDGQQHAQPPSELLCLSEMVAQDFRGGDKCERIYDPSRNRHG
jgi:hypothetical protein